MLRIDRSSDLKDSALDEPAHAIPNRCLGNIKPPCDFTVTAPSIGAQQTDNLPVKLIRLKLAGFSLD
jgi:hypothetical protein